MRNQKGMIMVLGLLLLVVLTIIGVSALSMTIFDTKISANYDAANQAFYTSDSGIEDATTQLKDSGPSLITDNEPNNPDWMAVIGTQERADQKGLSEVTRLDKIEPSLDYFVTVKHKVNSSNQTLKWGDANGDGVLEENTTTGGVIYLITSEGLAKENSQRVLQAEVAKLPPVNVPAAVYTKFDTKIHGTSTKVLGSDACGTNDKPGIVSMGTITLAGHPTITGSPVDMVENSSLDININNLIEGLKGSATHSYDLTSDTEMTGQNWGTPFIPAQDQPSTCTEHNVVYFNAHGHTVKLTGGTSGCGTLIIDGNLEAHGGFNWNGLIIMTGSITVSGNIDITGGVMSGSTVSLDTIGGNVVIIYCSIALQTNGLPPVLLNWKE